MTTDNSIKQDDYNFVSARYQNLRAAVAEAMCIIDHDTEDEDRVSDGAYDAYMKLKKEMNNPSEGIKESV